MSGELRMDGAHLLHLFQRAAPDLLLRGVAEAMNPFVVQVEKLARFLEPDRERVGQQVECHLLAHLRVEKTIDCLPNNIQRLKKPLLGLGNRFDQVRNDGIDVTGNEMRVKNRARSRSHPVALVLAISRVRELLLESVVGVAERASELGMGGEHQ